MKPILLLVAAVLQQQPQVVPQRGNSPQVVVNGGQPTGPVTAFDSTIATISSVGIKVAEMKSGYEAYSRAVHNGTDGQVLERAAIYGRSCRAVAQAIREGKLCRGCIGTRNAQTAVDQYRTILPEVQRVAQNCVTRIDALLARGTPEARARALRTELRPIGGRMYQNLQSYEARVHSLRVAMGWEASNNMTPRRGS